MSDQESEQSIPNAESPIVHGEASGLSANVPVAVGRVSVGEALQRVVNENETEASHRFDTEFSQPVADLIRHTDTVPMLGEGASSRVYPLDVGGAKYAVRVLKGDPEAAALGAQEHVGGLAAAQGVPGAEQLVAVHIATQGSGQAEGDQTPTVVVSELAPGKTGEVMTSDDVLAVNPEHVPAMLETLTQLQNRNVFIDGTRQNNYMYDPDKMLTIVDLALEDPKNLMPQTLEDKVMDLAVWMGNVGDLSTRQRESGAYAALKEHRVQLIESLRNAYRVRYGNGSQAEYMEQRFDDFLSIYKAQR